MPDTPVKKMMVTMTWPSAMSTFVLNRVCQLIRRGGSVNAGFKQVDMRAIADDVFNFYGQKVTANQVYNHLRHWRVRWVQVLKLKRLENVRWDEATSAIMMDEVLFSQHIQVRAICIYVH
jgi:hypothetical protein